MKEFVGRDFFISLLKKGNIKAMKIEEMKKKGRKIVE